MSNIINFNKQEENEQSNEAYVIVYLTNGHAVKLPADDDKKNIMKASLEKGREKWIRTPAMMISVKEIVLIDFEPFVGEE